MQKMDVLALVVLGLYGVRADSHSLRCYSIGVSAPGYGLPQFSTVVFVDDQQTELYTSDIRRRVPVAPWFKENEDPQYWEMTTQNSRVREALFKHEVKIVMNRFNHTGGFHFVQVIHGCELREDGSTKVYQEYRYDGREYMYLDVPTGTFIPTMAEAQITAQRWNSPDVRRGKLEKDNLENKCIEKLKMFLKHGREDLERRVQPGVKVIGQESGEVTKLHCLVYGFHPRAVDVKWMKNGTDDVHSYETTGVLLNPDGTYQIRVTAEVIAKEGDSYSCYVDHSSLEEPLLVRWDLEQDTPRAVIIGAVVIVLILTCVVVGVLTYRNSHSLRYYHTGVSAPGSDLTQFSTVVYVDDQQTERYSSDIRRRVPVAPWMKEKEDPQYWEMTTQNSRVYEAFFRHEVKIVVNRFNHTGGFHFIQVIHGCELRDDGSTVGFQQYTYDGREYIYLDVPTATFIPTMAEAQVTTQRWNSPDVRRGKLEKDSLENTCIWKLKRFIEHGREDLERRVRPGVKVTRKESGEVTKLHCLVYGFHPRAVDVKWMKNGIDDVHSYETTGVLPNPDGTYQIRVTAEVIPKEGDSYSCYVDHSSLEEPLLVKREPEQDTPRAVIIGAVVIVLVLSTIIVGVITYRKKKVPHIAASNEEMREAEERPMT